jgi:flagellar protein FlaI
MIRLKKFKISSTGKKETPKSRAGQMLAIMKKNREGPNNFVIYPNRTMIILPKPVTSGAANIIYPLIRPYAYANIRLDKQDNLLVYSVIEPKLSGAEQEMFRKIKDGLVQIIDISLEDLKEEGIISFLEESVNRLMQEYGFDVARRDYMKIMYYVYRDFVGLNQVEPFMHDPYIEDIGCDGVGIPIYIVHQRFGSLKTNIVFNDIEELREFVTKLAERCDRYISYAEPLLDGSLKDGTRVQASLASDVTTRGPTFSLRKFREVPITPMDMIKLNTASSEILSYLWFLIENGANILIAGGVSTGKTSMLNALSMFIPGDAKIVSIEDTRELNLPHENWIPGVSRSGFAGSKVGEVTMFELLRESFRQNPDYLIVGEIRGKEAYVMFQGMASGHPSISTMHAGSVDDLLKRLRTRPINLSAGLLESLDVVIVMIHAREKGKSARRIKEIVEIESIEQDTGTPRIIKAFAWIAHEDIFEYRGDSWLLHKIAREKGLSMGNVVKELLKKKKFIEWMFSKNLSTIEEQVKYINLYYRNQPVVEKIMKGLKVNEDELNE